MLSTVFQEDQKQQQGINLGTSCNKLVAIKFVKLVFLFLTRSNNSLLDSNAQLNKRAFVSLEA